MNPRAIHSTYHFESIQWTKKFYYRHISITLCWCFHAYCCCISFLFVCSIVCIHIYKCYIYYAQHINIDFNKLNVYVLVLVEIVLVYMKYELSYGFVCIKQYRNICIWRNATKISSFLKLTISIYVKYGIE